MALFDRASALAQARSTIHEVMGVSWDYTDMDVLTPVSLAVRWSRKPVMIGDLSFQGWPQQLDNENVVIFDSVELNEKGITLQRGGLLTGQIGSLFEGVSLVLDSQMPVDGNQRVAWKVAQK